MEFLLLNSADKMQFETQLLHILEKNDSSFVPPLSQRTNTTQTRFQNLESDGNGVKMYFEQMMKQSVLAVLSDGQVLGFVSYIENMVSDMIDEKFLPNIYISTVLVRESARGMGLTGKAYAYLFDVLFPNRNVFTRTWSTNVAHIKILERFGFSELKRIPDDRGKGIDTVYFYKNAVKNGR